MKPKDTVDLLNSLRDPFNTRLDLEVCDKYGRILRDGTRPILRFRGGEFGKIRSAIDLIKRNYMGEGEDYSENILSRKRRFTWGSTYCAYSLADAMGYSLRRSCIETGGGRYNPAAGDLLKEYHYGFPFLIAIDIRRYLENHSTNFSLERPGEITINEPILLRDIALLFGPKLNPHKPWDKSVMVNYLADVNGAWKNQTYIELLQRQHDANLEDAAVKPPELIGLD